MLRAIHNLREVQQRCVEGQPLDPEIADWLAQSLGIFLNRECSSLDDALGLMAPKGGVPWWLEEGIRIRDGAIRELAELAAPGQSSSAQARRVRSLSLRYAATAWRYDREREDMPMQYEGTLKAPLWRAFKSGAAMPVSERHLRTILGC